MIMDFLVDKKKILEKIEISRKGAILSLVGIFLFLVTYKLLPKTYATFESNIRYWIIWDILLCAICGIKIQLAEKWNGYFAFFMIVFSPLVSFGCIEKGVGNKISSMQTLVIALNYLICLTIYLLIYFFSNSVRVSIMMGSALFCIIALTNSFVNEFKGNSIRISDVFSIKTAVNVAGGYEYLFTEDRSTILLVSIMLIFLAFHIGYKEKLNINKLGLRILTGVLCITLFFTVFNQSFIEKKNLKPYIWELAQSAKDHGSLLDFVASFSYLKAEKPENYTKKMANYIEQEGAKHYKENHSMLKTAKEDFPDIIVIMNESLSDLERFDALKLNGKCLEYFQGMDNNVIRGNLSVPVWGGLTANTEFEFITGFSYSFMPSGVMAYQNYVREDTYNLGQYLNQMGYYSIFMHPYEKSGWNRSNVYSMFGFDEALYIDDYNQKDLIRDKVSDSANYKEVIERYKKAKETNDSVFIFNVTMQNHGGYTSDDIEKTIKILDPEGEYPKTEEYLNLVKKSDEAFKELIDYYEQCEEPTVICMFGDHLPVIEEEMTELLLESGSGEEIEKKARKYQTPFLIYANFDIEEKDYENISCNYLQTLLMETAGLPLNTYQQYLGNLYEKFPVINQFGVKDFQGNWYTWEEASRFDEIKEYEMVQYKNLFDS